MLHSMTRTHHQRRRAVVKLVLFLAFVVGVRRGYVHADAARRSRAVRTPTSVLRTQDDNRHRDPTFSTNADDDAPRTPTRGRAKVEYDGTLIASASTVGHTLDAAACEAACARTRGCNVWVRGRSSGACWLKRRDRASEEVRVMSEGEHCAWDSGTLDKDYVRDASEVLASAVKTRVSNASEYATLVVDGFGAVRLKLRPDWHRESVEYLRALAVEPDACKGTCEMYRVEPGFLVQGTLKSASVGANSATKDGPRLMVRGDVGWAGEGPGPDFFVYLGAKPADWLGKKHTVFAEVADEASLAVLERVVNAPSSTPGGPGTMRFIDVRPSLRVSLD